MLPAYTQGYLPAHVANFLRNATGQPHTQFHLPAQVTNFLRNAIGQPHSSYPIPLASAGNQFPQECHQPATQLIPNCEHRQLISSGMPLASHIADTQFYLPQVCHWPAIQLIPNSTCQHIQPISSAIYSYPIPFASGMPLASHMAHTKFYLPVHAANFPRNGIGQPQSSYLFLVASTGSQFPQECYWQAIQLILNSNCRHMQPNSPGMPLASHITHTYRYSPAHIIKCLMEFNHRSQCNMCKRWSQQLPPH